MKDDEYTKAAWELIGHNGKFKLPNGRTIYDAVLYNEATARSDRVRLARLDTNGDDLHQVNRWIDWEQPIAVLADEDEDEKV